MIEDFAGNPVIVGGGITGLVLADLWSERKLPVSLVEKDKKMGGLAKSIVADGFPFDLGPHRFFSLDPEVGDYIDNVLGDHADLAVRNTSIFLQNAFCEWPITRKAVLALPVREILRIGVDLLFRSGKPVDNCEDFIINRYGATLHRLLFAPITEKFFHEPSRLLDTDWAIASIDRAIIDKYRNVDTLVYMINRLIKKPDGMEFIYPDCGGIQTFSNRLYSRVAERGTCQVAAGSPVVEMRLEDGHAAQVICEDGREISGDSVFWTGSVCRLWDMLYKEECPLTFLSTAFFFLTLKKPVYQKEQWVYIPEPGYRALRISFPENFSQKSDGMVSRICVEITVPGEAAAHFDREKNFRRIVFDLQNLGIIPTKSQVESHSSMVVPETYPVYTAGYKKILEKMFVVLGEIKNLYVLGRSGMFWYNNMDNSIKSACEFARWLDRAESTITSVQKADWAMFSRRVH